MVEGKDDGVHLVKSRGLAFIPCATAEIAHEQGLQAPITKVVSRAFVIFRIQDRTFDSSLDWMQASSTAQSDDTYTRHIHTRRDPQRVEFAAGSYRGNALLTHLRSAFPGHFLPDAVANAYQK